MGTQESRALPPLRVEIECAIARGWSLEETCGRLGCTPAAVKATRALLDELVSEDPPFVVEPPTAVQRQRRRAEAEALKQMQRVRLLAVLEKERRIVAGNAWASHERAYQRAMHAAWKRQYRAKGAA